MPKPSSLKSLPPAVLAQVNIMVTDGGWTLDQIVAYLAEAGHPRSRSAVGRYGKDYAAVSAKLREGREITAMLTQEMGAAATDGKQGRFLVEVLRRIVNDRLMAQLMEGGENAETKDLSLLARTLKDMSAAVLDDQTFEVKARQFAATLMEKKVAEVEAEAATKTMTPQEALDRVRALYRGEL